VPPLVAEEFGPLPGWITKRTLGRPIPGKLPRRLDPGEREAIALALELKAERVILDDLPGRKAAGRLGLPVIGVLGILLACKLKGLISAVKPSLEALRAADFHFTPAQARAVVAVGGGGTVLAVLTLARRLGLGVTMPRVRLLTKLAGSWLASRTWVQRES
jgi:hypothetical protein